MENEEVQSKKSEITWATINSTAKRKSCMRILEYLSHNSESATITEISDALDMDWMTCKCNLVKLMGAGFLELEEDKMDERTRYFKIAVLKAIELKKGNQQPEKERIEELDELG
jgi:DNA-binding MarR family transcriptional regulator